MVHISSAMGEATGDLPGLLTSSDRYDDPPSVSKYGNLVGGLEHQFYFPIQLGIIIPIDFHIFQRGSNHQPVII